MFPFTPWLHSLLIPAEGSFFSINLTDGLIYWLIFVASIGMIATVLLYRRYEGPVRYLFIGLPVIGAYLCVSCLLALGLYLQASSRL